MTFTTRANVKERLGIATATTDFDDVIDQLIVEVSGMIDDLIGRDLDSAERTEYYDGTGSEYLLLRHGPLASVAGVWAVTYSDDGADNRVETATELTEPNRLEWGLASEGHLGQSAIVYNFGRFTCGRRNWKVQYTAGYASVPASLEKAATYEVVADFLTRETSGLASKVIGDAQQNQLTPVQRRMALERAVSPYRIPVVA